MRSRANTPVLPTTKPARPLQSRTLLLAAALLCLLTTGWGQSRSQLEGRRKQLIEEINATTSQLEETKKTRANALDSYFTLQVQIQNRQELISTLREEIEYTEAGIERTREVLAALRLDLDRLKREYAAMLRTAYRHKLNNSYLLFLFSADSFNDAFRRWQYLRQYERYRNRQAQLIEETQQSLAERAAAMEERRREKAGLLASSEQQQHLLARELERQNTLLASLKTDEKELIAELNEQQAAHRELNNAIESVIREEMARKRRDARNPEVLTAARRDETERPALSGNFQNSKGRLAWPVKEGTVSRPFGTQSHPTLKGIMITNNGIDIQTQASAEVFAIYDGTVAGTQFIPGYQNMVIIQHGDYYTVYSHLAEVFVSRGDGVKGQQIIGRVGNDRPEVHFEIWREKQRLNPIHWVSPR